MLVGMMIAHQLAIVPAHLLVADKGFNAEDDIRVVLRRRQMPRLDAGKVAGGEAEDFRDAFEIGKLALVDRTIGLGNVEQTVDDVFENLRAPGEEARQLARIGVIARDILLGEIEHARHAAKLALRHVENLLERDDLVARDNAVGFRHLGAERDDADGKGNRHFRIARPGDLRKEGRNRVANDGNGLIYAEPDGHAAVQHNGFDNKRQRLQIGRKAAINPLSEFPRNSWARHRRS
jgi:hypothetical protein